jgi:hypothetical protein
LALSVCSSAQYAAPASPPPHVVSVPVHVEAHAPCEHTWPAPHALPHAPQFAVSFVSLTQALLHAVVPPAQ